MTAQHDTWILDETDEGWAIVTDQGQTVAEFDADEPTARLLTAAPLMLEALRDALEELETLISADQKDTLRDPITDSTTDERVVRIRAAIRAATGEDA